jgi:hypothetical protein
MISKHEFFYTTIAMTEKFYKWNKDNVLFLTKEAHVEITTYGYPKLEDGSLYYYADQVWLGGDLTPDRFGRNQIDAQFIRLCYKLSLYFLGKEDTFKRLTCTKEQPVGDRYIVRLQTSDEDLRMELSEMYALFVERLETKT